MHLYWWNILIINALLLYLFLKIERLSRRTKELRRIIARLEGFDDFEEMNFESNTGDAEGMG